MKPAPLQARFTSFVGVPVASREGHAYCSSRPRPAMMESPIVTTTCFCGTDAGAGVATVDGDGARVAGAVAVAPDCGTSVDVVVDELVDAVAEHPARIRLRAARTTAVRA